MVGITGGIILIIVLVVVIAFAGEKVQAFVNDTTSILNAKIRDTESKIPAPQSGQKVCDLLVTIKGKWVGGGNPFVLQHIIYLNDGDNKITQEWNNCHTKKGISTASLIDFSSGINPLEFIVPRGSYVEEPFYFSITLIDPDTDKEKKLPHHQKIPLKVPALKNEWIFTPTKIVYRELVQKDYQLYIYVEGDHDSPARFADHNSGQPYIQEIHK